MYDFPELLGPTNIVKGFMWIFASETGPKFFTCSVRFIFIDELECESFTDLIIIYMLMCFRR